MRFKHRVRWPAVLEGPWLRVPKSWVDEEKLQRELTISNGAFWTAVQAGAPTAGIEAKVPLYREGPDWYDVPRHYRVPYTRDGASKLEQQGGPFSIVDPRLCGPTFGMKHKIVLRDQIQERASESLQQNRDKILALSCGKGKTVVSLHASVEATKLPVLVVVHTNALMDQWKERIRETWLLDGRPPMVGHIQQDVLDWNGRRVAVAMLHTLIKKELPPAFYAYWRLVIFDEVHRLGAASFSQACSLFPCERWGLSATLKREDGMDKVIQLHLGKVAFQDLSQPLKPKTYFIKTAIAVKEATYMFRRGRMNLSKLMTDLGENDLRNKLILYWLEKAAGKGRTILVLGERLTQLHYLHDNCKAESKSLHVGDMDRDERAAALKHQVVFATQHLAKEGLDRPMFDTLFILFPFGGGGRLQQSVGRILRIQDGKKAPKVFVFEDTIGIMAALANKMRTHLKAMGFESVDVQARSLSTERAG